MKTISSFLLLLFCLNSHASNEDLKRFLKDREQLEISYKRLQDSVFPGRVLKLYLINEQLLKITSKDDSIINITNSLIKSEAAYIDSLKQLNTRLAELSFDNDRLQERTLNDLKMMLILKIAVAVLLVSILVLIYFLATKRRKEGVDRDFEEEISGLESLNISLKKEIERQKVRELQFKDDLERSVKSEQDRYNALNESYNQNLSEIQQLKKTISNQVLANSEDSATQIKQLKVDNDQLVNKVSLLQLQLEEARIKNQSILKKINKLITDLSSVN
jgi:hypothetical protein